MQCNTNFLVTLYAFFFGTFSNIVKADDGHITRNGQPLAVKDADGKPRLQVAEHEDAGDAVLTPGAQLRPDFVFA